LELESGESRVEEELEDVGGDVEEGGEADI
jgi:hypothetical protein